MIFHQCRECNKSFQNGVDLLNHIENYHCQMATLVSGKCPYCESKKISQFGLEQSGDVSFQTGELQGEKHEIYFCEKCNNLSKN